MLTDIHEYLDRCTVIALDPFQKQWPKEIGEIVQIMVNLQKLNRNILIIFLEPVMILVVSLPLHPHIILLLK